MSRSTYPLKLPNSIKNAAAELAKLDGVSLNQFIAAAVAEKIGTLRTASEFLQQRAGTANPRICCVTFVVHRRCVPSKGMSAANVNSLPTRIYTSRQSSPA